MIVKPTLIINVPQNAMDGATVEFSVSVPNGTATAYQWSFEPTSGGNNPQVNFTAPTAATTQAKAHWFAKPNQPCTNLDSKYTIKVKVSFQNRSPITKDAPFRVSVGSNWGGVLHNVGMRLIKGKEFLFFLKQNTDNSKFVGLETIEYKPNSQSIRAPFEAKPIYTVVYGTRGIVQIKPDNNKLIKEIKEVID